MNKAELQWVLYITFLGRQIQINLLSRSCFITPEHMRRFDVFTCELVLKLSMSVSSMCVCVCVCVCVYKNTHSSPVCFIINMAAPSGLPHLHWFCHNWWGLHVTAQPFSASLTFLSLYFISQISTTPPPVALFVTLSPDLTSSPRLSVLHINPHQLITEAGMLVNSVESENITTELKEFSEDELLITFGEPPLKGRATN